MIKKGDLLLRIIELESVCNDYEDKINALKKKVEKLEKTSKEDGKKTAKKLTKKG